MRSKTLLSILITLPLVACFNASPSNHNEDAHSSDAGAVDAGAGQLLNQGAGEVMTAPLNVYLFWYGQWDTSSQNLVISYINGVDQTPYYDIVKQYYQETDAGRTATTNKISVAGSFSSGYTYGQSLVDGNIPRIVLDGITNNNLVPDPNAFYVVLTDKFVSNTSGFCTTVCGWHTHTNIGGVDIKYAFIGDPIVCLEAGTCIPSFFKASAVPSPNNDVEADSTINVLDHELMEIITDPDQNAWRFPNGDEIGDACSWNFGTVFSADNGGTYNIVSSGKQFLVQQLWSNGACAMSVGNSQ